MLAGAVDMDLAALGLPNVAKATLCGLQGSLPASCLIANRPGFPPMGLPLMGLSS